MKIVMLFAIRMYWRLIPAHRRRRCLFKKSCSHFVFDRTRKEGFHNGLKAFWYRFNTCRPGFQMFISPIDNQPILILKNGDALVEDELSDNIIEYFNFLNKN